MPRCEVRGLVKAVSLVLVATFIAYIAVSGSNSFHKCVENAPSYPSNYETFSGVPSIDSFLTLGHITIGCTARFADVHNGAISAIAALIIAWLTTSLVSVTSRQAELTEASIKVAERALTDIERAFVSIDGFNTELSVLSDQSDPDLSVLEFTLNKDPSLHITRLAVQPRWKNSGSTPTKNMRFRINWTGPAKTIPLNYNFVSDASDFLSGQVPLRLVSLS